MNQSRTHRRIAVAGPLATTLLLLAMAPAMACIWSGEGSTTAWSEAANWSSCSGGVPQNGSPLLFPEAGVVRDSVNDLTGLRVAQIQITAWNYHISGLPIELENGISVLLQSPIGSDVSPEIWLDMTLLAPQAFGHFGNAGQLAIHGDITLNGSLLILASGGVVELTGNIHGSGGLVKQGAHNLILRGFDSDYAGQTLVSEGVVQLYSSRGLGASGPGNETVVEDGATVQFAGASFLIEEDWILAGNGTSGTTGVLFTSGSRRLTGSITLTDDVLIRIGDFGGTDFNGVISGNYSLTKTGSAGLNLNADNTYTGFTTVNGGQLRINGEQPQSDVFVTGGLLSGNGRVGAIIATTGRVRPQLGATPLRAASVTFFTPSTFEVTLLGLDPVSGYGQLEVGSFGVIISQATLEVNIGFTAPAGSEFVIINNTSADPVEGAFAGLPEGSQLLVGDQPFAISYTGGDGNDVVLRALGQEIFFDRFEGMP